MHIRLASTGLLATLLGVGPAFGHAKLLETVPVADADLASPPVAVVLKFNEDVRLAVLKVASAGHEVPIKIDRSAPPSIAVRVSLPPLTSGKYDVVWSVVTVDDGHVVKGSYSFTVH
jgi:methionine-rich copper-binding protein CopC